MSAIRSTARRGAWVAAELLFAGMAASRRRRTGRPALPDLGEVRSILAIRLDLMGDLLFTLPALYALREAAPQARITLAVQPYTAQVARAAPFVDRVITLDVSGWRRPGAWARGDAPRQIKAAASEVRSEQYDLCVSFYGKVAASVALLSGARFLAGYRGEGYPFTFDLGLEGERYRWRRHESEYCLDLARALGADGGGTMPALEVDPAAEERVRGWLAEVGGNGAGKLVALHPGALNMAEKRWLPERWAAVADRVQEELGARVVLVSSPSELPLARQLEGAMRTRVVSLAGRTSLGELMAVIKGCDLFLGGDSGPLHMASALGVPSVSVYGPTDPVHTGPLHTKAMVLAPGAECGPCYDPRMPSACRQWRAECMERITVDEVFEAARGLIG